jgi:hypothetical protein
MEIEDIPSSLEAAYRVVEGYVVSDVTSTETKEGHVLTNAVTDLLCQYQFPSFFLLALVPTNSGAVMPLFSLSPPSGGIGTFRKGWSTAGRAHSCTSSEDRPLYASWAYARPLPSL